MTLPPFDKEEHERRMAEVNRGLDESKRIIEEMKARDAAPSKPEPQQQTQQQKRYDWALFGFGVIVGLLIPTLMLILATACKCPPTWIP